MYVRGMADAEGAVPSLLREIVAELRRDGLTVKAMYERITADGRADGLKDPAIAARIATDMLRR